LAKTLERDASIFFTNSFLEQMLPLKVCRK